MTRTVFITGCSSGIGRAATDLMIRKGWQVVATARDPGALGEWVAAPNVLALRLDVTDEKSIAAAVARAVERFGRIDVLVNNAGYGSFGPLEGTTEEEIELQFRTNVLGALAMIRHVMPVMRAHGGGTILNVSSIGGLMAAPFASLYHASKFALEGFSDSFRHEAALHRIRVKLIEPGHFKTGFISRSLRSSAHPDYDAAFGNYMEWVRAEDLKAPGPEPVAEAILRAAEDGSARLRYRVKGTMVLALTRIIPDAVWRSLYASAMTRRPKKKPGT